MILFKAQCSRLDKKYDAVQWLKMFSTTDTIPKVVRDNQNLNIVWDCWVFFLLF